MLPNDLALKPGECEFRIDGSGLGHPRFSSTAEVEEWLATSDRVGRAHMTMYFAHDNSGVQREEVIEGASVVDNGTYVAIRAAGEGRHSVDRVLAAIKKRAENLEKMREAQPRRQRDHDLP